MHTTTHPREISCYHSRMNVVMRKRTVLIVLAAVVGIGLGFFAGYRYAASHYQSLLADFSPIREKNDNYDLVTPLLGYHAPEATELGEYTALKGAIQKNIT